MMRYQAIRRWSGIVAVLVGASLLVSACATTRATRKHVETTGFLGDYSQLRKGGKDDAQLIFIDPATDFSAYHSVIIESVTLWQGEGASGLSADERQMLTDYFFVALTREFEKDFTVVHDAAPGTLMIRAAITEAKGSKVVANTVTSVVPQLRLLSTIGGMATDASVFVGEAGIEVEIRDAVTLKRLGAGVDRRAGTKAVSGGVKTWSDAKSAFDFWASRIHKRMAALRDQDSV